ncbi:MAG: iron ABC transporter permease [Methanomicrobiales archaeon]|nr:iron ABC transporter permease [Methanomicrobiales archaeon]
MKHKKEGFGAPAYLFFILVTGITCVLCVCIGSVTIPIADTLLVIWNTIWNLPIPEGIAHSIIVSVRIPRAICVALVGASLALCGAAMQGLLRNPLADGSTLGVSSGAALGACIAITFGITIPWLPRGGAMFMAILFAFISLILVLSLAYNIDFSLSTNTIILIGVIFTMFMNSIIALVITFAGEKIRHIMFWTLGSLSGTNYTDAMLLTVSLVICGAILLSHARELNAFAIGEQNARHVGVNVGRIKIIIMVCVSILIGVSVSIGGTIAFVGLVIPHMTRMIVGPNHKRLLVTSLFFGAVFLMLADLVSRILLSPLELPIGVVTSFVGSIVFVYIFTKARRVQ